MTTQQNESSPFGNPGYGITRNLGKIGIADARPAVEAALKEQGFGVLTEIDVSGTLKKKIDADIRPYLILGACNPKLAHEVIQAENPIGLLLPCNVVLAQEENGDLMVSAIDPVAMFQVVNRDDVASLAEQVKVSLQKAIIGISI